MASPSTSETAAFAPRPLKRSELLRFDVYMYDSPKIGRRVSVLRPAALAMALEHEFSPETETFVERPRYLKAGSTSYELSFWTRSVRGFEQFQLLTGFPAGTTGELRSAQRKKDEVIQAGKDAQIALLLKPEAAYLQLARANANRMRLLPYVQTARELSDINTVKSRVVELFAYQERLSFHRIEQAIKNIDARNVRAATCALIHSGDLRIDLSAKLHVHSNVEKQAVQS